MRRRSRCRRHHPAQILDAAGHRRMAGRAARRGRADAGRHRPRLLVPAALFRGASPQARLARVPRRFPAPLADRRRSHLCRFRPRRRIGNGAARMGNARWRRLTEERAGGAKSVFHFDVQGSVAKSTHAGIPWLRFIRQRLGDRVHFWPFDGWEIPAGRSAIAEVYPSLWSRSFAREGRNGDQHDAYCIAAWLSRADRNGSLAAFLKPDLTPPERTLAQVEGWILGVPGLIREHDLDREGIQSHATTLRCTRSRTSSRSQLFFRTVRGPRRLLDSRIDRQRRACGLAGFVGRRRYHPRCAANPSQLQIEFYRVRRQRPTP